MSLPPLPPIADYQFDETARRSFNNVSGSEQSDMDIAKAMVSLLRIRNHASIANFRESLFISDTVLINAAAKFVEMLQSHLEAIGYPQAQEEGISYPQLTALFANKERILPLIDQFRKTEFLQGMPPSDERHHALTLASAHLDVLCDDIAKNLFYLSPRYATSISSAILHANTNAPLSRIMAHDSRREDTPLAPPESDPDLPSK